MAERRGLRLVALDIGAESGRAVVGHLDGDRLAIEPVHRFANTPVAMAGTLHWDFPRLFGDVLTGLRAAGAGGPVASVGVDTWGVDFGFLDARGRLLANPVHYRDTRTAGMVEVAYGMVPKEDIYGATGIQIMPINSLYQLLAMARADDPLLGMADRLLMMPDLFHHFLGGSAVAEYTQATTSQCLDPLSHDWARGLLERLRIPTHFLPEVVPPGTVLGPLRPEVAEETGLAETLVVAPAAHDTASAVVGTPFVGTSTAFISSGTWSLVGLETRLPVIDERTLAANLTNEGGYGGTITLLRNVMGLWLVQQSRRALSRSGEAPSYEQLQAMAEAAPAATAFIDPDDERFLWPGDMPARVRDVCVETGQPVPEDTGTLIRVILESLALKYAWVVDTISAVTGQDIDRIHIVGGGVNNRLLCQLTADISGREVTAGPVEATAIGSLAAQAIAAGELSDVVEARELVARSFPMETYEPGGDWSEARARFDEVLARAS